MPLKHDVSKLKTMSIAERKAEAMRQLKASYDRASSNGELRTRMANTAS